MTSSPRAAGADFRRDLKHVVLGDGGLLPGHRAGFAHAGALDALHGGIDALLHRAHPLTVAAIEDEGHFAARGIEDT
jgi:hypothetical protein